MNANDCQDRFRQKLENLIENVEKRIGRQMTESQKEGLWSVANSQIFLEAIANGFYFAQTDADVNDWLLKIGGYRRKRGVPLRQELEDVRAEFKPPLRENWDYDGRIRENFAC